MKTKHLVVILGAVWGVIIAIALWTRFRPKAVNPCLVGLNVAGGASLRDVVEEAVEWAEKSGLPCEFVFNGVGMTAQPWTTPADLIAHYHRQMEVRAEAFEEMNAVKSQTENAS